MSVWSVALLVFALIFFLVSTRQIAFRYRAPIWLLGVAALVSAIALVARDDDHAGLFRAALDLAEHWNEPSESVLAQALNRNGPDVGRFVLPLLDLFLVLGAILAVLSALAFTRGEGIEKAIRPLAIGLIGAIVGGVLALAVVGTGFGAPVAQRAYTNFVSAKDIHDGDTFWIGEVSVRLLGADAPEGRQRCLLGDELVPCGEQAANHLRGLLNEALVTCFVGENSKGRTEESFGRPLVTCRAVREAVRDETGRTVRERVEIDDVARKMIADGFAVEYRSNQSSYRSAATRAANEARGLTTMCSLTPTVWRRDTLARTAFIKHGTLPADQESVMGRCGDLASNRL